MLVEDYMHSLEEPLIALNIVNRSMDYYIRQNFGYIKKGDKNNILKKVLALLTLNKMMIKKLQKERERIRKTVNTHYKELLENGEEL